jgi:long-chain acyl-CoA synthetase
VQRFLPGIGKLLERFKGRVVPVFIHGTWQALPPGRVRPRRAQVTVIFGRPIHPDELARRGEGTETAARITNALRDEVAALDPEGGRAETQRPAA